MLINGSVINGEAINGPGVYEKIKQAIELTSEIPTSAKQEAKEFVDGIPQHILDSLQSISDLDFPPELYEHSQKIYEIIQLVLSVT